jgi:hypothetical protein
VGRCLTHYLVMPAQPSGENLLAGPCSRHRVGAPRAVTAHCRHAVARPVRLTGSFPGNKILTVTTGEPQGDGQARCWEVVTHRAVGRREGVETVAGNGI